VGFGKYVARSITTSIPVLIGTTFVIFSLMYVTGDPVRVILGEFATEEQVARLRAELGLDKPIYVQYFLWLSRVLRGDFGISYMSRLPVMQVILERLPATLMLTGTALVVSLAIGISLGIVAALRQGTKVDTAVSTFVVLFFSMPYFWFATILLWVFASCLRVYPLVGTASPDRLVLPAVALGLPTSAVYAKLMRSNMVEVLHQDYIRTAVAKGLRDRIIIYRHALKNSIIPIVALVMLRIPWLVGGAVITESVFGWPGLGTLLIDSIYRRDFPVVQGICFIIAVLIVISDIVGDLVIALIDPRVRVE